MQDVYRRHITYVDDPSSDSETETTIIHPERFFVQEMKQNPWTFYAETAIEKMNEAFRRFREFTGNESISFNVRALNIPCLEKTLVDAQVVGYTLLGVDGAAPYNRLQMEGPQIGQNTEAQDFVQRAGRMQSLSFQLQAKTMVLRLVARDDGSITFRNYPGDSIALDIIGKLEPLISGCSATESVQVRQRRGR